MYSLNVSRRLQLKDAFSFPVPHTEHAFAVQAGGECEDLTVSIEKVPDGGKT